MLRHNFCWPDGRLFLFSTLIDKSPLTFNISQLLKRKEKSGLPYPYNRTFWFLVNIYMHTSIDQICVEVFEKTIRRTEMIDHSFERKSYGA